MAGRAYEGSWSRAYMAASGLALGARQAARSPELILASGATLPPARVTQLSHHRDPEVREAIARREDCPYGVLASLAHDTRAHVRIAVACHPSAGRTILEHLARDRDPHVVKAVARNPITPWDIVTHLSRHRRDEVSHAALRAMAEREEAIHADTGIVPVKDADALRPGAPRPRWSARPRGAGG